MPKEAMMRMTVNMGKKKKKTESTLDTLKAINYLKCLNTNSEEAYKHLKAVRDLEKAVLTIRKRRQS